jgi:indolepyruvate ferredoxin oxidoreductase alpha subunit
MGAGIGQALGMEKAGITDKIVAVIGDSTFLHSGITGLINSVYNGSSMTLIILDNRTTAMTGHQHHPGTGFTAQGAPAPAVDLINLVKSCGASPVLEIDAFDIKALRAAVKSSFESSSLNVLVVRGPCVAMTPAKNEAFAIDITKCTQCGTCLILGCSALRNEEGKISIDGQLCRGEVCKLCQQLCSQKAIGPITKKESVNG